MDEKQCRQRLPQQRLGRLRQRREKRAGIGRWRQWNWRSTRDVADAILAQPIDERIRVRQHLFMVAALPGAAYNWGGAVSRLTLVLVLTPPAVWGKGDLAFSRRWSLCRRALSGGAFGA